MKLENFVVYCGPFVFDGQTRSLQLITWFLLEKDSHADSIITSQSSILFFQSGLSPSVIH